jgi:hypothetical protein
VAVSSALASERRKWCDCARAECSGNRESGGRIPHGEAKDAFGVGVSFGDDDGDDSAVVVGKVLEVLELHRSEQLAKSCVPVPALEKIEPHPILVLPSANSCSPHSTIDSATFSNRSTLILRE